MEAESDLKPWQCKFCTFMNEPTWLVCGMCFKECEAPNDNGYQVDFPNVNLDDLIGLDAAPEHSVQPVAAMVSAAAMTNASRICVAPIPAVAVASTSLTPNYFSTGDAPRTISSAASTSHAVTAGAPFSSVSFQNISLIRNDTAAKKYTPYTVAPVSTIATSANGWARNANHRLVRVTAPTTSSKTAVTSVDPDLARIRVITPQSNPYSSSNNANIVTSAITFVPASKPLNAPSYSGGIRLRPLRSLTKTPPNFPTGDTNTRFNFVTPLIPTSTTVLNYNSYNVNAQFVQSRSSATSLNSSSYTVASSGKFRAPSTTTSIAYNTGSQPGPSTYPAAPVHSHFPNVFQHQQVSQSPQSDYTETSQVYPNTANNAVTGTSTLPFVPNTPPVTSASTFNGAARVTTAAFADAYATDSSPGWMCFYCTFINDNLLLRCAVCDTKKPKTILNEHPAQILPLILPPTDNIPNVANNAPFECPLCYLLFDKSEGIVLENCGHTFCKNCLRNVICYSVEPQLKCPFKNKGVLCHNLLTEQEIGFILNLEINNPNVVTVQPVQQNVPRLSPQNISLGTIPGAGGVIDLTNDAFEDPPLIATRNSAEVVGKELNYQELLELEKEVLIPNIENFDCTICMAEQGPGEGVVMRDCLHMFCRECLKQAIKCNMDAEMKCPFGDGKTRCESVLQDREIKALVDVNDYEKHLSRSIKEAENTIQNTFHCKTVDCIGWCEYEDEVTEFVCPVCSKTNCINCKAIHTDLNCKQYQINVQLNSANNPDDAKTNKMLQSMLKKGTAMNCPKCGIILSKVTGCDWLCCSMCKTAICWVTRGPRWGPKGQGDTTGGCRCRLIQGKPCHPKCGNCH